MQILGHPTPHSESLLTKDALAFLHALHTQFNPIRKELLGTRQTRQKDIDAGHIPQMLTETESVRSAEWQVAPSPSDLQDRRVEITGPVERKMMINALNSGAKVFMADLEDSLSPTWENVIQGQINLRDAVRRNISLESEAKRYQLKEEIATLLVRPRGWHLEEKHLQIEGEPISASLFDFALYFFHNAKELLSRGSGPYFYLPKLESHLEARLWNDVFVFSQDWLGIPQGTIRATVLIETVLAALEMEEILYELRDHASGLNAGRWDYIFSVIKKFSKHPDQMLPDRAQITMTTPFMRAYTELMVKTCHKRGAHAIGGMSAFIPSRRDEEVNRNALTKVRADKEREATDGCDGTWVAHPDLVAPVLAIFDQVLGEDPHQKHRLREDVSYQGADITDIRVPNGSITEAGLRLNISVAIQYIGAWLLGDGAVGINNLMEDAATAEISRAQLWQWVRHGAKLDDGRVITAAMYQDIREEELNHLASPTPKHYTDAADILDKLVLSEGFIEFLTLVAYDYLS